MAKRFTQEELNNIINDYNDGSGLKPYELGERYGRNPSSIINKLKDFGIYKNQNFHFTSQDVEYLKEHYPCDSWDELFKHFPNTPKDSIIKKASVLKIKRNENDWTDEEIEILKENYKYGEINNITELLPGRTYGAITTKATKLGIKCRELWSNEEDDLLRDLYEKHSINDILKYFPNRSRDSIVLHAEKLNLKSFDYNPWTEAEDNFIRDNYELTPDIILAEKLGRTKSGVKHRRNIMKLYRVNVNSNSYESLSKYIRGNIYSWKLESMKNCSYECVLTGSKDFQVHHLYSVSGMINDIFQNNDIIEKKDFLEYTDDELKNILNLFIQEQSRHPLGVCVSKDLHVLFHKMYGKGYNNPEQWYRFEEDFKNGVYDKYLKDIYRLDEDDEIEYEENIA